MRIAKGRYQVKCGNVGREERELIFQRSSFPEVFYYKDLKSLKNFIKFRESGEQAHTAQKMKFSIKDLFSKCDQIRRKLRIWSHLLKKSLMENFIFCAVIQVHANFLLTAYGFYSFQYNVRRKIKKSNINKLLSTSLVI